MGLLACFNLKSFFSLSQCMHKSQAAEKSLHELAAMRDTDLAPAGPSWQAGIRGRAEQNEGGCLGVFATVRGDYVRGELSALYTKSVSAPMKDLWPEYNSFQPLLFPLASHCPQD